ncbi:MAG: hypothetical protein C4527_08355 [Candidatus Omnitrophota bacterium]|nr:MAG: hypothetical protein C4527_08355 [Candidatus Omnitrophota bacterium]
MIELIDPIGSIPLSRLTTPPSVSTSGEKKGNEKTDRGEKSNSLKSLGKDDQVSLSFNLKADVETLKESVTIIFGRIKNQLEEYYGLRGQEEEDSSEFLPSEDASAQELLDFFGPEKTAERILNFTTSFFDSYQANHQDVSRDENVNQFTILIGDAIRKGFQEAEKILGDFNQLGKVGEKIKETYQTVLKGLENYRRENLNDLGLLPKQPESLLTDPEVVSEVDTVA